jgi:hypothetical protein
MKDIIITWNVRYEGEQEFHIDPYDFDDCETYEDIENRLWDLVQEQFQELITFDITSPIQPTLEAVWAFRQQEKDGEV